MAPWNLFVRTLLLCETAIVNRILASPGFHRAVGRIHRRVEDYRFGRNPHEPLRPGEATEEPNVTRSGFLGHFVDELKNQIRGTPTNPPPSSGPPSRPKR
ncbi:uncharacterized protein E0L32_010630 [Thyridium curvatum]|uniref:Secreted protein n=1 Tax=Thyridium curvatum TaxID=1093900 RepID=A0A507AN77_9PEZI|nr:uncharacterized protein E0L32_010630 [Thyridium curvatum]TPX07734.1 hypothetical protein E0L32_010630 [Thyridium curvatum]